MRRNPEVQSTEPTDGHRAEPSHSRSRRDFLKKAATVSILGMTGLTAAAATAEPVRAGSWRGPFRLSDGETETFSSHWTGEIKIDGFADYSDYRLIAYDHDGPESPNRDYLRESSGVEAHDELDTDQLDQAFGEIQDEIKNNGHDEDGHFDRYYYEDNVKCIVTSGIIDVFDRDVYL